MENGRDYHALPCVTEPEPALYHKPCFARGSRAVFARTRALKKVFTLFPAQLFSNTDDLVSQRGRPAASPNLSENQPAPTTSTNK